MKRLTVTLPAVAAAAVAVALSAGTAGAAIDGVSGQLEWLHSPPASVQPGALSSETVMRAFDERQKVTLAAPLAVNISRPGTYKLVADETPATIPAGTVVDSHLVHVDKDTQFSTILTGTIHLDSDVLGIVLDNATSQLLDASDYLGRARHALPGTPPLRTRLRAEREPAGQDRRARRQAHGRHHERHPPAARRPAAHHHAGRRAAGRRRGPPASGAEGSALALAGSVTDPDTPSPAISWSYAPLSGVDAGATCSFASSVLARDDDHVHGRRCLHRDAHRERRRQRARVRQHHGHGVEREPGRHDHLARRRLLPARVDGPALRLVHRRRQQRHAHAARSTGATAARSSRAR